MTKICKERVLYEIQGIYYVNCDVTAVMDKARLTQVAKDWVERSGVTGKIASSNDQGWYNGFWLVHRGALLGAGRARHRREVENGRDFDEVP
jgi:hypothetical protein